VVLQVFDYVNDDWVSLQKLCGRDTPSPVKSGSMMRVLFHSNSVGSNNGFKVIILFYYNFHSAFVCWHHVEVACVATISGEHASSIFSFDVFH